MHKETELTFEELRNKLLGYITDEEELNIIRKAYMYAFEKHFGQQRLTGIDYIQHPLNVAYILTEIHADYATISAGLLHDLIDDCDITKEEINSVFGSEIASLVEGVTKINKLNFTGDNEAVISYHRKILVGLSEDVRVIIIKLADRLHNMRTLWALPEDRQKAKAKETLDILTPIAHRLGIGGIKSELEDLSLRYYKPDAFYEIVEKLNQSKVERDQLIIDMKYTVSSMLNEHNIKHEIKGRAKSIYSIYKKLDKGRKWSDIYDLLALRVYVDTEADCYQALGIIHSKFKPIPKRLKDYIAMPKANLYQSLHTTVFGEGGNLYEIQIRTFEMDKVAELGIASHWSYKEKGSNFKNTMQNAMEQKLEFFRNMMELKNEGIEEDEYVRAVSENILNENIYVYTPKGDVIELPTGSTPIDFAYRVHSTIGDKMVGAIVNGNIVPLDYILKDNDIVKINTNNNTNPNREWINMAFTRQAKNKIKSFFNSKSREEYLKKGETILRDECRKKKEIFDSIFSGESLKKILEYFKLQNLEELYINVGSLKITPVNILNFINDEINTKEEAILKKAVIASNISASVNKNDIIVKGIDEVKINIALCCKPVPNDRIVGYITKGEGISIHRMVCPNVSISTERLIEVCWNESVDKKYPTTILLHANENNNLLLKVVSATSNTDVDIQTISNLNTKEGYLFEITVLVKSKEKLMKFIDDLKLISSVQNVERIIK